MNAPDTALTTAARSEKQRIENNKLAKRLVR